MTIRWPSTRCSSLAVRASEIDARRRSAVCLTLSRFVDKIAALIDRIFVPSGEFFCGSRMRHHRSIADSRPGQLSNSAPEP
jgi:hypothetical protein